MAIGCLCYKNSTTYEKGVEVKMNEESYALMITDEA